MDTEGEVNEPTTIPFAIAREDGSPAAGNSTEQSQKVPVLQESYWTIAFIIVSAIVLALLYWFKGRDSPLVAWKHPALGPPIPDGTGAPVKGAKGSKEINAKASKEVNAKASKEGKGS